MDFSREKRILDLFCSNKPNLTKSVHVIPGLSDHEAVCADCDIQARTHKKPPRKIHQWSKADWAKIKADLCSYRDKFLEQCHSRSVEDNYADFKAQVNSLLDKYVPTKKASTRLNTPWLTGSLRRMCRKKRRLYVRARKSHRKSHWEHHKAFKKDTLKALRRQRWSYINDLLQVGLDKGDSRPLWGYLRSQRQDNMGVSPLKDGGILHSNSLSQATILNNQFKSVFNDVEQGEIPRLYGPDYPDIADLYISIQGVEKLLHNICPTKAAGPDSISCCFLKECSGELAPILSQIFNQSLLEGVVPSDWRKANVAPVFKKGNRDLAENYRPVSLTCVCCKIMEHIICSHIRSHLDKHGILSCLQHGFRKFFSCETQLLVTLQDLVSFKDKNTQIDMAVLDFSKAFDTVPHKRLLGKLSFYGVKGDILSWVQAFLEDREQKVVVDGRSSSSEAVTSGVPQGTVLGPLLFLLYINDLPSVVSSQVRLFADDCLMYRPIRSVEDQVAMQRDLDSLERWGDTWGMRFNAKKCHIMTLGRGRSTLMHFYSLCGEILSSVDEAKYLGINISHDLSWSPHVQSLCSRGNSTLGFLRRNLRRCPAKLKEQSYIALVRSVLEYGAAVWDPHLAQDINSLEKIQRKAARFAKGDYRTRSSVSAMLKDLKWDELKHRRRDLRLALMFKIVKGHVGVTPDHIGLVAADKRTRANHRHKFRALGSSSTAKRQSFAVRTIGEWNKLPASAVEQDTPAAFKAELAKLYHQQATPAP